MKIRQNITEMIGKTPLIKISTLSGLNDSSVVGKLEYLNPGGSVKDRIGLAMIEAAERSGLIDKDTVIIEPTSGNTGIALAMVCAARGLRLIIVMPDSMSLERRKILQVYGAELILTPAHLGMNGAINEAVAVAEKYKNHFIPQQFKNPANPEVHRVTTAEEIWEDTDGKIDIFVSGIGTGGTFTGVSEILKKKNSAIKTIAVEPEDSNILSGGKPGPHKIQGIGAGFIPDVLIRSLIDEVITVSNNDAFAMLKRIAKNEGILCGPSSGAALHAASVVSRRPENKGKMIVTIMPDSAERYLSMSLFDE